MSIMKKNFGFISGKNSLKKEQLFSESSYYGLLWLQMTRRGLWPYNCDDCSQNGIRNTWIYLKMHVSSYLIDSAVLESGTKEVPNGRKSLGFAKFKMFNKKSEFHDHTLAF